MKKEYTLALAAVAVLVFVYYVFVRGSGTPIVSTSNLVSKVSA